MSEIIRNPILPGFHPDPSICRVGADYYLANSTFQWWPGVGISHSRDLVRWELVGYALTRTSQLDMARTVDSTGIWAPCLSYNAREKLFYLIYTNTNQHLLRMPFEAPNYLVTARDVRGPWSEPVLLNRSGFDPSLFHDEDGRAWLVNMVMDDRPGHNFFSGILLQEYSRKERRLVGPIRNIFRGTALGFTEGPHLFKRGRWYYLIVAEGGTGYAHAMTMARSRRLGGPYEIHPHNPIMTAWNTDLPLQKAGHGQLVETAEGEWYGAFLCGRPRHGQFCILGRETALERGAWREDEWFYFDSPNPRLEVPGPKLAAPAVAVRKVARGAKKTARPYQFGQAAQRDDFDARTLGLEWNTPREPLGDKASLAARPGWLRLYGQPLNIESNRGQAFVARRIEDHGFEAATLMEFKPASDLVIGGPQEAGLVCFYSHTNYLWLRVTQDETLGPILELMRRSGPELTVEGRIPVRGWRRFHLRVTARNDRYQFAAGRDGKKWIEVGPAQDGTLLSDESSDRFGFSFTGAFVGLVARDMTGGRRSADFDWFDYRRVGE